MHKKYTYKDGKRYGPYLYENKRVGEHVVTRYVGRGNKDNPHLIRSKFFAYFLIFLASLLFIISMNLPSSSPTGKVSLEVDEVSYNEGEPLSGVIRFNLKEGEFIPSDSMVRVMMGNEQKEYVLDELVDEKATQGTFYAENSALSGSGEGFGKKGKKNTHPEINFELSVVDSLGEEKIISGTVSNGHDFVYSDDYVSYQIVPGSVTVDGESADFSAVSSEDDSGQITITTDYGVTEEGYGEDYLGEGVDTLSIPVDNFHLNAGNEVLKVELLYNNEIIASADKEIVVESTEESVESNEGILALDNPISIIKNVSDVRIPFGRTVTLILDNYFSGASSYSFESSDVDASIESGILHLTPQEGFKGVREAKIIAYSGDHEISSNTFQIIVSSRVVNIQTTRSEIRLGEPVKWSKNITLESSEQISVQIPIEAENVEVTSIENGLQEEASSSVSSFTGNVVIEIDLKDKAKEKEKFSLSKLVKKMFDSITGNVVSDINVNDVVPSDDIKEVFINDSATQYVIEYETPAPESVERISDTGKTVVISAPDDLGYTNILSFTEVPEIYRTDQSNSISIYWVENKTYLPFDSYDLNNNGKIDYLEWITPHLSNQTFEIILISKAQHLDASRTVIGDIYSEVRELDNLYSRAISDGEFARVTFERNLTGLNDITVYTRTLSGSPKINIYEKDGALPVASFEGLIDGYNQVYLSGLAQSSKVFDLEVIGGSVSFDYITDPTYTLSGDLLNNRSITSRFNTSNEYSNLLLYMPFDESKDTSLLTVSNSVDYPGSFDVSYSGGSGNFDNDGETGKCYEIFIYGYKNISGSLAFSSDYASSFFCDTDYSPTPGNYYWSLDWDPYVPASPVDGYRVVVNSDDSQGWTGDHYYDTTATSLNYGDGAENSFVAGVPTLLPSSYNTYENLSLFTDYVYGSTGVGYNGVNQTTGIYGNGVRFDGVNDYIDVAEHNIFNSALTSHAITFTAWINYHKLANQLSAIGRNTGACGDFAFDLGSTNTSGSPRLAYHKSGACWVTYFNSTFAIQTNKWYHHALVLNDTGAYYYVDGTLVYFNSETPSFTYTDDLTLTLGSFSGAGGSNNVSLDEVMVFGRALTASQVSSIYANQSSRFINNSVNYVRPILLTNLSDNYANLTVPEIGTLFGSNVSASLGYWKINYGYNESDSNLVAYYHADGNANDSSGNNHNGTFTLGATANSEGLFNGSFLFNGTNYINITNFTGFPNGSSARSTTVWAKTNQTGSEGYLFAYGNSSTNKMWAIGVFNDDRTLLTQFGNAVLGRAINDNQWHFISVTFDGTKVWLYVDGKLESSKSVTVSTANSFLQIGCLGPQNKCFKGYVDELMMWNKTLTSVEVRDLYAKGRANWDYTGSNSNYPVSSGNEFKFTGLSYLAGSSNLLPTFNFTSGPNNFYTAYVSSVDNITLSSNGASVQSGVAPNASNFSSSYGGTDFNAVSDYNSVSGLALASSYGSIKFPGDYLVNASSQDYDRNVIISNGFVSVNISALDSSFNSSANISVGGVSCPAVPYYNENFYSTFGEMKSGAIECNASSNPSCTNIVCSSGQLNFTSSHFSGFVSQSSCGILNESNTVYTLQNDITNYATTCFTITADNVTLNGNGYSIDGVDDTSQYGIYLSGRNISVINFTNISDFYQGIYAYSSSENTFSNILLGSNVLYGIDLWTVTNSALSNITIYGGSNAFYLQFNSDSNIFSNITAYANSGIGLSLSSSNYNLINGFVSYNNGRGIYALITNSNSFRNLNLSNHSITGIEFALSSQNNTFENVTSLNNSNYGLRLGTSSLNNSFTNFVALYNRQNDLSISGQSNGTLLSNVLIGNYSIVPLVIMKIKNTSFGEIQFTTPINGTGLSFVGPSSDVMIGNNSIYINSSKLGLNKSANITLYGTPSAGKSVPVIKRNGALCTDCYNFTSLSATTVIFNVSSGGNYSIGDGAEITSCTTISTPGITYNLVNNISTSSSSNCIVISANNVVFNGNGYTIDGDDSGFADGIKINAGSGTNVTINNVVVSDFYYGLTNFGGDAFIGSTVKNSRFESNNKDSGASAILVTSSGSMDNLFENNIFYNNTAGYQTTFAVKSNLTNNTFQYNFVAVYLSNPLAINNRFVGNKLFYNTVGYYLGSTNNTFIGEDLQNNTQGFYLDTFSYADTSVYSRILNVTFIGNNYSIYDIGLKNNSLVYNNSYGQIDLLGKAYNLTFSGNVTFPGSIIIANNSAYVNGSQTGLDTGARITLRGLSTNLTGPAVFNSGVICTDCYNFTNLNAGTVIFNVSSAGNYSIGDLTYLTSCRNLDVAGYTYTLANDIVGVSGSCFNITASDVTLEGNGHVISSAGSPLSVGVSAQNVNNIRIRNLEVDFFTNGITLTNVSSSFVQGNRIYRSSDQGLNIISSHDNNASGNILLENNDYQILLGSGSYGNYLVNNTMNNTVSSQSIIDLSGDSLDNYLFYSNAYGQIRWIDFRFLRNLTTKDNLSIGASIVLTSNNVGIDADAFTLGASRINTGANVTIYSAPAFAGRYRQALFGISQDANLRCTHCYNFTNLLSGGTQLFNVSYVGGEYSIGLAPRSKSRVQLGKGWNLFGITTDDNYSSNSNVTITLHPGRNYIGFSGANNISRDNITATYENGTQANWTTLIRQTSVYNQFAYYDAVSNLSRKRFKYAPLDDSSLRSDKGYIVDLNETLGEDINLTFKGSGGSLINDTYAWKDLMFLNESSGVVKNITEAVNASWVFGTLQYWDRESGDYGLLQAIDDPENGRRNTFSSWEGIQVQSFSEGITLLRQD